MAEPRHNPADRVPYEDWLRFRFMVTALKQKLGVGDRGLSKMIGPTGGYVTHAMRYPYNVQRPMLRAIQDLARQHGVPVDPPRTSDGRIPQSREEVSRAMASTENAGPGLVAQELRDVTEGRRIVPGTDEDVIWKRLVNHLRMRGVQGGEIAQLAGYGNPTSIYPTLQEDKSTSAGRYNQLIGAFRKRYGEHKLQLVANGGTGFEVTAPHEEEPEPEPAPAPEPEPTPAPEPERAPAVASFERARLVLTNAVDLLYAVAEKENLPDGVITWLENEVILPVQEAADKLKPRRRRD